MPMDFPDFKSLERAAEVHKFRKPNKGEPEESFRNDLADHVAPRDFIESEEIRNKVGWDKFSKDQNQSMLMRGAINSLTPHEKDNINWLTRL